MGAVRASSVKPPIGADAVVPERAGRLAGLRLARLRLMARGRLAVHGNVQVERGVRVNATGGRVVLEDGCVLGAGCRIEAAGGDVRIGAGTQVGARAILVALAGIDVGADCVIGEWVMIADAEPTFADAEQPTRKQPLRSEPVVIGDGARIGAHASVLTSVAAGELVGTYETRAPRSTS